MCCHIETYKWKQKKHHQGIKHHWVPLSKTNTNMNSVAYIRSQGKSIFTITFVLSKNSSKHLERNMRKIPVAQFLKYWQQFSCNLVTPWNKLQALNKHCLVSHRNVSEYKNNFKFGQKGTNLLLTCSETHPGLCQECILGQRGAECLATQLWLKWLFSERA